MNPVDEDRTAVRADGARVRKRRALKVQEASSVCLHQAAIDQFLRCDRRGAAGGESGSSIVSQAEADVQSAAGAGIDDAADAIYHGSFHIHDTAVLNSQGAVGVIDRRNKRDPAAVRTAVLASGQLCGP